MQPNIWQLLIVAALVLILFGRGKISEMMGDVGKGIKSFKKGLTEDVSDKDDNSDEKAKSPPKRLSPPEDGSKIHERDNSKSAD